MSCKSIPVQFFGLTTNQGNAEQIIGWRPDKTRNVRIKPRTEIDRKNEREKLFLFLKKLETKSNLGRKKETLNVFYLLKGQKVIEF